MSKHTIPTELNIAPRGKSWLNGQLIDGVHGHPTRQSMESAERAALTATTAAGVPAPALIDDMKQELMDLYNEIMKQGRGMHYWNYAAAVLDRYRNAFGATPAAAPDMVSVNKEDANNYCRILTALGMEEDGDPVAEVQSLLAAAAAPVVQTEVTWCEYIAGMIGCYLKEPDESPRVKAIAGIIERRLWALPSPKPVARTDKPASFEAWAKSEGGPFALHNCGPYNRDAMKLAGMAWHASALLATATGLPAQAVEQAPVLYVSKGQLANHRDPDGPESASAGRYLPARITPAGKFTTPLFADPQVQLDARDDSALLDAMERQRIALVPEYEGPWDAEVYNGDEKPNHRGSGSTPREAIRAAVAAAKGE